MIGTIIGLMEPPSVPPAEPLHAQRCLQTGRNSVSPRRVRRSSCPRRRIEGVSTVCFRVGGREFSIERHAAAIFATNLDKLSTGKLGDDGRAGAPSLLEKVDDVVVGNSHNTIELEGDEAETAFYVLNVSIDAPSTEQRELAAALRRLRDESVRG
jgi:hypothetical protein